MMQTLYPIVRRVRRPLLVAEPAPDTPPKPPAVAGNVEPVKAEAARSEVRAGRAVTPCQPKAEAAVRQDLDTTTG